MSKMSHIPSPRTINGRNNSEDQLELELRIYDCIEYTRLQHAKGDKPQACTYFSTTVTQPLSDILKLLRNAKSRRIAYLISKSTTLECYSLGVPPPARKLHSLHPQWWLGLSRAEIRAGPIRTDADTKRAEAEVNNDLKRKRKSETDRNGKLKTEKDILAEGLRRQLLELPLSGQLDQAVVQRAMAKNGHKLTPESLQQDNDDSDQDGGPGEESGDELASARPAKRVRTDSRERRDKTKRSAKIVRRGRGRTRGYSRASTVETDDDDGNWNPGQD